MEEDRIKKIRKITRRETKNVLVSYADMWQKHLHFNSQGSRRNLWGFSNVFFFGNFKPLVLYYLAML